MNILDIMISTDYTAFVGVCTVFAAGLICMPLILTMTGNALSATSYGTSLQQQRQAAEMHRWLHTRGPRELI